MYSFFSPPTSHLYFSSSISFITHTYTEREFELGFRGERARERQQLNVSLSLCVLDTMIQFMLLYSRQGKIRLAKWYTDGGESQGLFTTPKQRANLIREVRRIYMHIYEETSLVNTF